MESNLEISAKSAKLLQPKGHSENFPRIKNSWKLVLLLMQVPSHISRLLWYINKYRYFFNIDIWFFDISKILIFFWFFDKQLFFSGYIITMMTFLSANEAWPSKDVRIFNRKLVVPLVCKYAQVNIYFFFYVLFKPFIF